MFPESVIPRGTIPQLDAVRDMKLETAKEWLNVYSDANVWNTTESPRMLDEQAVSHKNKNSHRNSSGRSFVLEAYLCLAAFSLVVAILV